LFHNLRNAHFPPCCIFADVHAKTKKIQKRGGGGGFGEGKERRNHKKAAKARSFTYTAMATTLIFLSPPFIGYRVDNRTQKYREKLGHGKDDRQFSR
jgi:hypothetical protein